MSTRTRRTPEQLISDLQAQIEQVKQRAAQKKAKADPTLRHVSGALKSIDKALEGATDAATKGTLQEARSALAALLELGGVPSNSEASVSDARVDPDRILDLIRAQPGGGIGQIAKALETTSAGVQPGIKRLREDGLVRTEGERRATKYFAVGSKRG